MCAKTTETSRCQRCGSEFDWLSDGTKVHAGKRYFESDSLLCLERQLNAANVEIEEKRKDVVWLATEKAKLENYVKRLEEAGDALSKTQTYDLIENVNWRKAKEAKL